MTPIEQFVVAMISALMPWLTIWVLAKYFLLHGKQRVEGEKRLLQTLDDLTACLVAMKNPMAASQFAAMKTAAVPRDVDEELLNPPPPEGDELSFE